MTLQVDHIPGAPPAPPAMDATSERGLYLSDRPAWRLYAAQRLAHAIKYCASDSDISASWERLGRELQQAIWAQLDDETRARVRAIREGKNETE